MRNPAAESVTIQALPLRQTYSKATAREVLNAALEGRHGAAMDFADESPQGTGPRMELGAAPATTPLPAAPAPPVAAAPGPAPPPAPAPAPVPPPPAGKPAPGSSDSYPAWVRSARAQPNTWRDIPGTRFMEMFKDNGSGVDAVGTRIPPSGDAHVGGRNTYYNTFAYGGPGHSRKRHEMYAHGSGHAAGTMNHVAAWRLGKDVPDMVLLSPSTPPEVRQADYDTRSPVPMPQKAYHSDGKPIGSHVYSNLQYVEDSDELLVVTLENCNRTITGLLRLGDIAAFKRSSGVDLGGDGRWRPPNTWPSITEFESSDRLICQSLDRKSLYFRFGDGKGQDARLRKLNFQTKQITYVTPNDVNWSHKCFGDVVPVGAGSEGSLFWIGNDWNSFNWAYPKGNWELWYARLIDLTTGDQHVVTINGPTVQECGLIGGVHWLASIRAYACIFHSDGREPFKLGKLIPTNSAHTAMRLELVNTAGTAPSAKGWSRFSAHFPDYDDILVVGDSLDGYLKRIKIT